MTEGNQFWDLLGRVDGGCNWLVQSGSGSGAEAVEYGRWCGIAFLGVGGRWELVGWWWRLHAQSFNY